jgi:uncharacterized membrane protein YgcG
MATRSIQRQTRPSTSQGPICERIIAQSTDDGRPNVPAKSHEVVAVVAGVWIFFLAKAAWVLPPESLFPGKRAPGMRNAIRILVVLCALFSSLSLCCFAQSQAPPSATEEILDYHSDIRVQQDASLLVQETIRVRSAGVEIQHGIYRDFPTRYKDRSGNRYVVHFKVVQVSRDGQPEKFHIEDQSNGERIYFGDENVILPPGEYTYALAYTANREIGFFADHDELYWNVTGTGWLFPIANASATVTLPENIPVSSVRMDGYTGPQGARGKAFTSSIGPGNTVGFVSPAPFHPGEGLTIVVSWPKGYIQEPSGRTRFRYFFEDNRSTLVGAAGLLLVLLYYVMVWFRVGQHPAKSSIMPIYEPPAGVSPAAMRYLVRMGFDDKTFAAAVIDMAVKKFLSIKEKGGVFTLQRSSGDKNLLAPEESAAAARLFPKSRGKDDDSVDDRPGRIMVVLKPNNSALRNAVTAVKKSLHDSEDKIYFVANQRYMIPGLILSVGVLVAMVIAETGDRQFELGFFSAWLTVWSVAVFFLVRNAAHLWKGVRAGGSMALNLRKQARSSTFFALPFTAAEIVALYALAWFTSVLVVLILAALVGINLLFHWLIKAPTRAGRDLLDKIEGFRMFLRAADGDRMNRLMPPDKTPELFEKYLPYAVALDSEQAWAQQFSAVLENARQTTSYSPTWYVGSGAFGLNAFALTFAGSFSNAIAASTSTPGTSSGSGGEGFSGGGGGGGGGGGW